MERRPLLLNSVLLRQNPHNVAEWQKRVDLLKDKPHAVIDTYTEAVQTVDPKLAAGSRLSTLWVNFAKFYEENKQIEDARIIFEKATRVAYLKVGELNRTHFQLTLELALSRSTSWPQSGVSGWNLSSGMTTTMSVSSCYREQRRRRRGRSRTMTRERRCR